MVWINHTPPDIKHPSKNTINGIISKPYDAIGVYTLNILNIKDKINPTQVLKHIGHENNLPKKLGLFLFQNIRQNSNIEPKTIIFVIP